MQSLREPLQSGYSGDSNLLLHVLGDVESGAAKFLLCATIARALAVGFIWFWGNNIRWEAVSVGQASYLEKKLVSLMRDLIKSEGYDLTLTDDIEFGFNLVGDSPPSSVLPP